MTSPIAADDVDAGFRSGVHALDDYLARHALPNENVGGGLPAACSYPLHERVIGYLPASFRAARTTFIGQSGRSFGSWSRSTNSPPIRRSRTATSFASGTTTRY